jgi:hypothetical protein
VVRVVRCRSVTVAAPVRVLFRGSAELDTAPRHSAAPSAAQRSARAAGSEERQSDVTRALEA